MRRALAVRYGPVWVSPVGSLAMTVVLLSGFIPVETIARRWLMATLCVVAATIGWAVSEWRSVSVRHDRRTDLVLRGA